MVMLFCLSMDVMILGLIAKQTRMKGQLRTLPEGIRR